MIIGTNGKNPIEKAKTITDEVNQPPHYTHGKIEAIDKILDSVEHPESYLQGNVLKYVIRYKHKGGLQDLEKAKVYLEWLIEEVKS
jgi:hypothetical protein